MCVASGLLHRKHSEEILQKDFVCTDCALQLENWRRGETRHFCNANTAWDKYSKRLAVVGKDCSCLVSLFFGWSYFVFVIFPEESENDPCHLTTSRSHTTVSGKGDFPVWSSRFYYCICWPSLLWLTLVMMTVISLVHGPGILKIFWEEFDYPVRLKFGKEGRIRSNMVYT